MTEKLWKNIVQTIKNIDFKHKNYSDRLKDFTKIADEAWEASKKQKITERLPGQNLPFKSHQDKLATLNFSLISKSYKTLASDKVKVFSFKHLRTGTYDNAPKGIHVDSKTIIRSHFIVYDEATTILFSDIVPSIDAINFSNQPKNGYRYSSYAFNFNITHKGQTELLTKENKPYFNPKPSYPVQSSISKPPHSISLKSNQFSAIELKCVGQKSDFDKGRNNIISDYRRFYFIPSNLLK